MNIEDDVSAILTGHYVPYLALRRKYSCSEITSLKYVPVSTISHEPAIQNHLM